MRNKKTINSTFYIPLFLLTFCRLSVSLDPGTTSLDPEPNCEELLMNYAEQTSDFTKCFIQHARPIKVCQFCIVNFTAVNESLNNITHLDKMGKQCKAELINMDRLQVIEYSFKYVTDQWCKAACEKCFEKGSKVLNDKSQRLLTASKQLDECILHSSKQNRSDIICEQCKKKYSRLNTIYEEFGAAANFCMDFIDTMNITRQKWSIELQCSSQCDKPITLYVIITFILLILPVIFYVAVWYYATPKEGPMTFQERWTQRYEVLPSTSSQ